MSEVNQSSFLLPTVDERINRFERRALLRLIDVAINVAPIVGVTKEAWQAIRQKIAEGAS